MNYKSLGVFRVLLLAVGFSLAFVSIWGFHLKSEAEAGRLVLGGKLITLGAQEEPALEPPIITLNLRYVNDSGDEVFQEITDKPPVFALEIVFRGERFLDAAKIEGTIRQLQTYLVRGLKTLLPVYAWGIREDGEGERELYVFRNGAIGLIRRPAGVFFVY